MTSPNDVAALVERLREYAQSKGHLYASPLMEEAAATIAALQAEVERAKEDERDRLLQEAVGRQVGPQGWRDIAAFLKAHGAKGPAARSASRKENTP